MFLLEVFFFALKIRNKQSSTKAKLIYCQINLLGKCLGAMFMGFIKYQINMSLSFKMSVLLSE